MDLSEIKSKLTKLQAKPGSNKTDKKNSGWKPSIGKQNVHIVPNKYNKKNLLYLISIIRKTHSQNYISTMVLAKK